MRIYFAIKYHADNSNRGLIEAITDILSKYNHDSVCIAKDIENWGGKSFSPAELMKISFDEIEKADLVLIEFSEKGVGLGIEAGYAYASNKPIVVLSKTDEVSTTLRGIAHRIYRYKNLENLDEYIKNLDIKTTN